MVVFECGKCNESVKKPKLEKHLQMCGSGYVSCIDCSKTFGWGENGWEWQTHTSCVSEAQKYQGNLFQAKEKENKGQAKQDTWTTNVEKAIEDSSASPKIKQLLQRLLGFDNVPRKEKAFVNFVKNSLKVWNAADAVEMWKAIASAAPPKGPACTAPSAVPPADAEPAPARGGAAAEARCAGWKRALDSELQDHGGEMPWKKLRESLIVRYRSTKKDVSEGEAELGNWVLSIIPDEYLSKTDPLVRLPRVA